MDGRLKGAKEEKGESCSPFLLRSAGGRGAAGGGAERRVKFLAKKAKQQWNFD